MQHGFLSHRAELVKPREADDGRVEQRAVRLRSPSADESEVER